MKKLILYASIFCMGMVSSCTKDELVPEDEKPEWLGSSIYQELANPTKLDGTFNTYLKLIEDCGYANTLSRTGSKTIFPANDDAFAAFFASDNQFGVHSYAQLSTGMKRQLLFSSMLDNAMLTGMLSNVKKDDNNVSRGVALKHATSVSVTDSIHHIYNEGLMPQGNTYWDAYRVGGIDLVFDATVPMMVHFTREQMLNNNITTIGTDCDLAVLRGEPIGTTLSDSDIPFIFSSKVVKPNITCQNGYIHQVDKVIVPPGNVGQVLRGEKASKFSDAADPYANSTELFSRIVDYHCAPYPNSTVLKNANDYIISQNLANHTSTPLYSSIYELRYFSKKSHSLNPLTTSSGTTVDPNGSSTKAKQLSWDLGWNQYTSSSDALSDMGAIFVPTDRAVIDYFVGKDAPGSYFIDNYGCHTGEENTLENLRENLDTMFVRGNGILTTFVNNLMQPSFIESVPSKFNTIQQSTSGEFMGLTLKDIATKDNNSKYDIIVANNGVVYKLNKMIVPDLYQSVLGPATIYPEMSIMSNFAQDKTDGLTASTWGADLYYYLLAMKSKYAFLVPSNDAFRNVPFINPMSLAGSNPHAVEFYSHWEVNKNNEQVEVIGARLHSFNIATGEINPTPSVTIEDVTAVATDYKSLINDLLQYHTIVLSQSANFGENEYYLTKHGGAVRLVNYDAKNFTGYICGGAQLNNRVAPAKVKRGWYDKNAGNGWTIELEGTVQPSITSVNKLLYAYGETNESDNRFGKFLDMVSIFSDQELLSWAGIAATATVGTAPQERYWVFSPRGGKALDQNVNFFNGYNYTFFAPDNAAMTQAETQMGLPTRAAVNEIYEKYYGNEADYDESEVKEAKAQVLNMLNALRAFVRYHFQNNSVFADKNVPQVSYQSMYSSELGVPVNITTSSTNGVMTVTDAAKRSMTVNANGDKIVNFMCRDYEFDSEAKSAKSINVSSFAVVHQISEPLCYDKSGRYDSQWSTANARRQAGQNYYSIKSQANNLND